MNKQNFSILEIIKNPIQAVFFGLTAATAFLFFPLTHFGIRNYLRWSNAAPSGYEYPAVADL